MSIKVILLDAYGTFINTRTSSVDATAKILSLSRSRLDPTEFYARWKAMHRQGMRSQTDFLPEREMYARELCSLYAEHGIDRDGRADVSIMLDSLLDRPVFPEVKEVFRQLSGSFRLIVASNTDTRPLMQNLEYNRLVMDRIYTSESLRCYKPAESFYLRILEDIGCQPEEAVFVGDSPEEDVIAPGRLGMTTVFLDRKSAGGNHGQNYTFSDLSGLLRLTG